MNLLRRIDHAIRNMDSVVRIGIVLMILSLVIGFAGYFRLHDHFDWQIFLDDFYTNTSTELGSIAVTVVIIDQLARRRDQKEHEREQFNQALQKLKSGVNFLALEALEEMWVRGWLRDGSLRGQDLSRADLRGADLGHADLTQVRFATRRYGSAKFDTTTRLPDDSYWSKDQDLRRFTNPQHPRYWRGYSLWKTSLEYEDYRNANLHSASLKHSGLYCVNFAGADMRNANFQQANLEGSCFKDARLDGARFDEDTILPDGTNWTSETDMRRFTDPDCLDYWQPDWVLELDV